MGYVQDRAGRNCWVDSGPTPSLRKDILDSLAFQRSDRNHGVVSADLPCLHLVVGCSRVYALQVGGISSRSLASGCDRSDSGFGRAIPEIRKLDLDLACIARVVRLDWSDCRSVSLADGRLRLRTASCR